MKNSEFVRCVQEQGLMRTPAEAVHAIRATLTTLGERLSGGEAKDLASQLPREVAHLLGFPRGERFHLDEFFRRVAAREGVPVPVAIDHARAVVSVLRHAVSRGEVEDVLAQLPRDFADLFDDRPTRRMEGRKLTEAYAAGAGRERHNGHPHQVRRRGPVAGALQQRFLLDDVRASEVMTTDIATVMPGDTIARAAGLMRHHDCGMLPVVTDEGRLVGVITDRDIVLRAVAESRRPSTTKVSDCMTEGAIGAAADYTIADCLELMARHQIRRLPVLDSDGAVIGVVSQADLACYAHEHRGTGSRRAVADMLAEISESEAAEDDAAAGRA